MKLQVVVNQDITQLTLIWDEANRSGNPSINFNPIQIALGLNPGLIQNNGSVCVGFDGNYALVFFEKTEFGTLHTTLNSISTLDTNSKKHRILQIDYTTQELTDFMQEILRFQKSKQLTSFWELF